MTKNWIDRHPVTCALCGGLADETETICWSELEEPRPGESTTTLETTQALREKVGTGEAHSNCFEYAKRNGVRAALEELEARTHR